MSIKKSQATLKHFIDLKQARREGGGGATGALAASHRPQRSTFLFTNDWFKTKWINNIF